MPYYIMVLTTDNAVFPMNLLVLIMTHEGTSNRDLTPNPRVVTDCHRLAIHLSDSTIAIGSILKNPPETAWP